MANDGGMTARLEAWIVSVIGALQFDGKDAFKTVDHWKGQIKGVADFAKYQPFAFVSFFPFRANREGDFDLRQNLRFSVLIGFESTRKFARIGEATKLGGSKARELVIDALDRVHPGEGFDCDDMEYYDEVELVDNGKFYAEEIWFTCKWIPTES